MQQMPHMPGVSSEGLNNLVFDQFLDFGVLGNPMMSTVEGQQLDLKQPMPIIASHLGLPRPSFLVNDLPSTGSPSIDTPPESSEEGTRTYEASHSGISDSGS